MNLNGWAAKRFVKDPELFALDAIRDTLPFVVAEQIAEGTDMEDIRFYGTWVRLLDKLPPNIRETIESANELEQIMERAEVLFDQAINWFTHRDGARKSLGLSGTSREYDAALQIARDWAVGGGHYDEADKTKLVQNITDNLCLQFTGLRTMIARYIAKEAVEEAIKLES